MANTFKIKLDFPSDAELDRMFAAVPKLEKYQVGDKVTAAGAQVVAKRAKQTTPRGQQADKDKWSQKTKQKRQGEMPLWKAIRVVTRKYGNGKGYSVVGPKWPEGNKAYLFTAPHGRNIVLWGRRTGRVAQYVRNWIVRSFDETKSAQLTAIKAKLTELMDRVMRG